MPRSIYPSTEYTQPTDFTQATEYTEPIESGRDIGATPTADEGRIPATVADHLRADGVSHSYGVRSVLTDVSLAVPPGARVGLIGENGVGKST
ncbi:MAG: ATP-binding cassette domain-containing protein, partial [Humibacter sp.]